MDQKLLDGFLRTPNDSQGTPRWIRPLGQTKRIALSFWQTGRNKRCRFIRSSCQQAALNMGDVLHSLIAVSSGVPQIQLRAHPEQCGSMVWCLCPRGLAPHTPERLGYPEQTRCSLFLPITDGLQPSGYGCLLGAAARTALGVVETLPRRRLSRLVLMLCPHGVLRVAMHLFLEAMHLFLLASCYY